MVEKSSLADVLSEYMERGRIKAPRLANLVNDLVGWNLLHRSTIGNWCKGTSHSVQDSWQLVAIAAALKLDEGETDRLLKAAGLPTLAALRPTAPAQYRSILDKIHAAPAPPILFAVPPRPPYKLVGRDALLRHLKQQLIAGRTVAISALNGLPGVGKTALAIELAHAPEMNAHFCDGVLWAGLGQQPDLLALLGAWGKALGMHESEMARLTDVKERAHAVHREIGSRRLLLIIDDAWTAPAALTFKIGGDNCAHLLTTRSQEIALDFAAAHAQVVQELGAAEGLALLATFVPAMVANEPEAAQALVQAAGGLPLALTLMGRYLQKESLTGQPRRLRAALERLQETKSRLQLEQPVSPLEQQPSLSGSSLSLWASIEISEKMLDETTQRAFRALSLFPPKPNTFSEEAAQQVMAAPPETLDKLNDAGLVESLGPGRYALHQTIADYARVLFADPAAAARMAHYYVDYVETRERAYTALDLEKNNVHAALEIAARQELPAVLVRGVNACYHFWDVRGLYDLAQNWLEQAEPHARALFEAAPSAAGPLVTTLLYLGRTAIRRGDYALAEKRLQEGIALAQTSGRDELHSLLLRSLGVVAAMGGDYEQAKACFEQGLAIARQQGRAESISALLSNLGAAATHQGRYKEAEAYYQEALPLARQSGQSENVIMVLLNIGQRAAFQGAYVLAEAASQEALALARASGHREMICLLLQNLGAVADKQKKYELAEIRLKEGLALARKLGHPERIGALLANLGATETHRQAYALARTCFEEALPLARALSHPWLISTTLLEWGNLHLQQGLVQSAAGMSTEALTLAQESGLRDLVGLSLFGLAQAALAQGDIGAARQWGQESLAILEALAHRDAPEVKKWLINLPAQ